MVSDTAGFERLIVPHLDAGYNLARWMLRDEHQAHDALQDAALRAFRFLGDLRNTDAKPWFLGIVRRVCLTHLSDRAKAWERQIEPDEEWHELSEHADDTDDKAPDPAHLLHLKQQWGRVDRALWQLPEPLRETLVLRELEDMSYEQIAQITLVPIGTVMSRLSRARARMRELLAAPQLGD